MNSSVSNGGNASDTPRSTKSNTFSNSEWFYDVLERVHESWVPLFSSPRMVAELRDIDARLTRQVNEEITIYPARENILRLFSLVSLDEIKCVIVGQDPYVSGDATGIAFSGGRVGTIPASLRNIWDEVRRSYPTKKLGPIASPSLEGWCEQGVFLLNRALTVVEKKPGSHLGIWSGVIHLVTTAIAEVNSQIPWLLWGNVARKLEGTLDDLQCTRVFVCSHPSPLSVKGFVNNGHFLQVNKYYESLDLPGIDWTCTMSSKPSPNETKSDTDGQDNAP